MKGYIGENYRNGVTLFWDDDFYISGQDVDYNESKVKMYADSYKGRLEQKFGIKVSETRLIMKDFYVVEWKYWFLMIVMNLSVM